MSKLWNWWLRVQLRRAQMQIEYLDETRKQIEFAIIEEMRETDRLRAELVRGREWSTSSAPF